MKKTYKSENHRNYMKNKVSFKELIKEISKAKLTILGEIHGTREIPEIVKTIIKSSGVKELYLEIPQMYETNLEKFFRKNRDGRGSKEYLRLVEEMKKVMGVHFIEGTKWNKDKEMYNNINNLLRRKGLVVCGNVHGTYETAFFRKRFGSYVKGKIGKEVVNVNIMPIKGKFYNFKVRQIIGKKVKPGIYKNFEKGYDYTYFIDKSTPCSFIN